MISNIEVICKTIISPLFINKITEYKYSYSTKLCKSKDDYEGKYLSKPILS